MAEEIRFPSGKAIIFRYVGGPKDGRITRFIVGGTPFDPAPMHPYEIVEKTETENLVTVRWEHRQPEG